MRLTNTMREAFVRATMQDVPQVDYKEQARTLATKLIRDAQKKIGLSKIDDARLDYRSCDFYHNGEHVFAVAARGLFPDELKPIKVDKDIKDLLDLHTKQEQEVKKLKTKLTGAINACTTRKQAAEALPEFEKYLPADEPKALRSLPALANVAADFVKAGWPKTPANPHRSAQPA